MATAVTIHIRQPQTIYRASGEIENGTFEGRWHFSFGPYFDSTFTQLGNLRVFNDDTLSPGAIWPLHPHKEIEVVTYCVSGEFRHADEHGVGGILHPGDVQHTTVGRGMFHSEINNLPHEPMRFIQMWFMPKQADLDPAVQQRSVDRSERLNRFLPLVSSEQPGALPLAADAQVLACSLQARQAAEYRITPGRACYFYVISGGPVNLNDHPVPELGAAIIIHEERIRAWAYSEAELLLVEVSRVA